VPCYQMEPPANRPLPHFPRAADPDLRIDREKLQRLLHARQRAGWAINVERAGAIGVIHHAHQGSQPAGVVAMGVRDEDRADIMEVGPEPGQAAGDPSPASMT
jgi:hypothetical protein